MPRRSERRVADAATELLKHLDSLIGQLPTAVVVSDVDGSARAYNERAVALWGRPPRADVTAATADVLRDGSPRDADCDVTYADGSHGTIRVRTVPLRDPQGRIVAALTTTVDGLIPSCNRGEQDLPLTVRTLEALYHLADRTGRAAGVADVCEAGIDAIMAGGADRAAVLVFDDAGGMRFRAWRHLSDRYRAAVDGHTPWPPEATDPSPVLVEDVLTDETTHALRDVITAEGIRALAFVPLVSHGRLLGKFMVYYDAPHAFPAAEMRLAATIAHHIAFGLMRVRGESAVAVARIEAEQRREVAEELARVAHAVNESLDVAAVGDRVVRSALTLFRARASALRLRDADGQLVGVAFAGGMKTAFAPGHRVAAGPSSVSGLAMAQGAAAWSENTLADPRLELAEDVRAGMTAAGDGAVLAVPLRAKGRIFGALSIADRPGRRFTAVETETLQALADQAALAIDNARLYEDARRQQREAELVAELARRMNASLDLGTTLERLVEGARDLIGGEIARIVVRDPASGKMLLRHRVGTRWPGYFDNLVLEPGQGTGGIVLATGRPFRTDDYAADPRITAHYKAAAAADGTVAQIVVPIPGESAIAGLLYVDRRSPRPFTEQDEAALLRLADHAGIAIRNSHLFAAERAARAEADAANAGKDRFLAVLSHELRTPLTAVVGWAKFLKADGLDEARRAHAVDVIARNAHLQAQLLSDMLDISRIAAGKVELDRAPVDFARVVRDAVDGFAADVSAKGLRLVIELDAAAGAVLADARRLQQIVSNLISNAVKFTPAGGQIAIRLLRHETNARLTVADSGEGIDPGLLPRIFDPFEQGDAGSTRLHQGLGLGLAIVRQLVELHGGTIRAESAGKGAGARFTIDLPVVAVHAPQPSPRSERGNGVTLRGTRVLVVDDQPDAREVLGFVLESHGAEVRVAGSVREALAILGEDAGIDVLVSDIAMPEADGIELIEAVRGRERTLRQPPIRAIALTANAGAEVRQRALRAGFDTHATKPLNPEDLVELVSKLSPA